MHAAPLDLPSYCSGYNTKKITENVEAEIMQVVLEEAKDSYRPEIVQELQSETPDDLESNVDRVCAWAQSWKDNNPQGVPARGPAGDAEGESENSELDY
jgi:broad-specificity NMP kinase